MKRKIKVIVIIIAMLIITPVLTGCGGDNYYDAASFIKYEVNGTTLNPNNQGDYVVTSNYNKIRVYISIPDEVKSYTWSIYDSSKNVVKSGNYDPVGNTPYEDLSGLKAGDVYYVRYSFYTEVNRTGVYKGYINTPKIYTYQPSYGNNSEDIGSPTQDLLNLVGGDSGYCNKDANGNKLVADTDNLFVKVAYSQIGYKEKATNSNINSCTTNSGSNNYQKYGNNGDGWCSSFITWALKKAGIEPPFSASSSEMKSWASNNGKLVSSASSCKNGDLALYNGHVAIVYIPNNGSGKYLIHGNWNNKVELRKSNNLSLDNKTFYGCASMKGYTY